ncbi:sensor histidine kinase [Embleya hyalina]|uniref:sensor histidine kinase n=1 Tax=Embleya hyalina TaxID=516124 RepID=UPI000F826779|nr:histidine kinase [Embleya hyalina]
MNVDSTRFGPRQWPVEGQGVGAWQQSGPARLRGHVLVVLLIVLVPLVTVHMDGGRWTGLRWSLLVADLVLYAGSFLVVTQVGQRQSRWRRSLMVGWLLVVGAALPVVTGDVTMLVHLAYAIVAAVVLLPAEASRLVGLGVALAQVIATRVVDGRVDWDGTWLLVLLTLSFSSLFLLARVVSQLSAARAVIAHQSVVDERNRLARDLHDVLGHTVATIALKGGVARRMLESDVDRDTVHTEVRDIEELSRKAMREIRSTIFDTRSVSLDDELANAVLALRAAGISATLPGTGDVVRLELRDVFAYVLREGVTNVIKHSRARRCEVRFGETWLELEDDGNGRIFAKDAWAEAGGGYGLLGLAERLRALGGDLTTGRVRTGGFLLRAEVENPAARPPATA